MAKKQEVLSVPGVRFVVNREGTMRWDELPPEHILEWVADDKEATEKVRAWMASARNGTQFKIGVNYIHAVEQDQPV